MIGAKLATSDNKITALQLQGRIGAVDEFLEWGSDFDTFIGPGFTMTQINSCWDGGHLSSLRFNNAYPVGDHTCSDNPITLGAALSGFTLRFNDAS